MKEPIQDLHEPLFEEQHQPYSINAQSHHEQPFHPNQHQDNLRPRYDQPALNPLRRQESRTHGRSLAALLFFLLGLIIALVLHSGGSISGIATAAIIVVAYVAHLMVGLCGNSLRQYLKAIRGGQGLEAEYDRTRSLVGKFVMTADCYHYETQTHTRTVTDSEGNSSTETYTTEEKVTTHSDRQQIQPIFTVDESGPCGHLRSDKLIIFIDFLAAYRFADPQSQQRLQRMFVLFKQRNYFDSYQSYQIYYSVPGLIQKHTFFMRNVESDFSVNLYMSAFFCMLWPYSLWLQSKIDRFAITFMKVVTIG